MSLTDSAFTHACEILDSRSNPTIEVELALSGGLSAAEDRGAALP
jgi:enolase